MKKQYDRAYFERWYHDRSTRVNTHSEVRRKVFMAVTMAEYFLRRPIRTVLDVGCGEAAWLPHLRSLRRDVQYRGLDPSEYVVQRFGISRNIEQASFADLPSLKLGIYDLVICSDVMHYVPNDELRAGMAVIAEVTDGLAYLEVLTKEDEVIGDLDSFLRRPASFYRALFTKLGLTFVGPYCWLGTGFRDAVAELEKPR